MGVGAGAGGGDAGDIWWREVRDAAEHPTAHRISSPTHVYNNELFLPQMSEVLSLSHPPANWHHAFASPHHRQRIRQHP